VSIWTAPREAKTNKENAQPVNDLLIVIRTCKERTKDLAAEVAARQAAAPAPGTSMEMTVIEERPFLRAVRRTFALGVESPTRWLLALDCDVLLFPGALDHVVSVAEAWMGPEVFRIDFPVLDKFRGPICAGAHLYDNARSAAMLAHLDAADQTTCALRPESDNVVGYCRQADLDYYRIHPRDPLGLHDHGQYLADLARKYAARYHRGLVDGDLETVETALLGLMRDHPGDPDYAAALAGLHAAREKRDPVQSALALAPEKGPLGPDETRDLETELARHPFDPDAVPVADRG